MKIEVKQNCLWIREAESPDALFANRENLLEQIDQQECLMLMVEPCEAFSMPKDEDRCAAIAAFFQELPVLTVIAGTVLEKAELAALLLFDIRLGCLDYRISRGTVLSAAQQKRYEILCGEKELLKYLSFAEHGTDDFLITRLVRILPQEADFHEEVQTYAENLLKDKTPFQTRAVISCFVQARTGDAQRVLNEESRQFYRLIKAKMEESANGTDEAMV